MPTQPPKYQVILSDIRFYILLFFILRLIGITNPPLEVSHNWRQTTVTMVARNFIEVDANPFYPRIDFAGEKTGITGMEFPLLNYLIYLASAMFGYEHWYGRLINLIFSSVGLWFFYLLVRKYFLHPIAFNATLILAVSVWFSYSRKIMPDTFSMSLVLMGLYVGTNYLEATKNNWIQLLSYMLLLALGVLSKLPSGCLLPVLVILYFNNKIPLSRKWLFATATAFALLLVAWWYFYWVPHLVSTYGFWHFFMGKSIRIGIAEIILHYQDALSNFYDTALKYIGFLACVMGLVMMVKKRDMQMILIATFSFIPFLIIMLKAGFTFTHHGYYMIPFVPVMALLAAYGLQIIQSTKLKTLVITAIAFEGIAAQQHDFRIHENYQNCMKLESTLDQFSERSDLILINSGEYPTPMYFAHRKGWIHTNEKVMDPHYIADLKTKGLKYIIILKRCFGTQVLIEGYPKMIDTTDFCIYKAVP